MKLFGSLESTAAATNGRARFVLRASLLAIVPSMFMFGLLVALGIETLRVPASTFNPAFMAYSALLAPIIETAVMLALAALSMRLAPRHVTLQIALVAFVTTLAHGIGGDWRQVLNTMWPILVYATCLALWLRRSASDAFVVTAIVHAIYNIAFFAVGILGALAIGDP